MARPARIAVFVLVCALGVPPLGAGAGAATGPRPACSHGYRTGREIAQGRFFDRRWGLRFFRDRRERPCLSDGWGAYGSIFRFRVDRDRPRLGILNLNMTSPPKGRGAYVIDGYVQERVARLTFRIDGRTRDVRTVRAPGWTRLPKDLLIHFVGVRRYDRDAAGRLRAFDARGRLVATRIVRRRHFFEAVEVD